MTGFENTYPPVASRWVVTLHSLFVYSDLPLPCLPPSYWLTLFSSLTFSHINTPTFLKPSHSSHLLAYEYGTDSVLKHRHVKFRCRGITQKKTFRTGWKFEIKNRAMAKHETIQTERNSFTAWSLIFLSLIYTENYSVSTHVVERSNITYISLLSYGQHMSRPQKVSAHTQSPLSP